MAGARVFLADAGGEPILGLAEVKTDAQGSYTIPNVPAGYTYVVVAQIALKAGSSARLTTLARSTPQGVTARISGETTLAAASITQTLAGAFGEYNQARFAQAAQLIGSQPAELATVDWASLTSVSSRVEALEKRLFDLQAALADLRAQVQTSEKSLEELKADVEGLRNDRATPAPSAAPARRLPARCLRPRSCRHPFHRPRRRRLWLLCPMASSKASSRAPSLKTAGTMAARHLTHRMVHS